MASESRGSVSIKDLEDEVAEQAYVVLEPLVREAANVIALIIVTEHHRGARQPLCTTMIAALTDAFKLRLEACIKTLDGRFGAQI